MTETLFYFIALKLAIQRDKEKAKKKPFISYKIKRIVYGVS